MDSAAIPVTTFTGTGTCQAIVSYCRNLRPSRRCHWRWVACPPAMCRYGRYAGATAAVTILFVEVAADAQLG